MSGLVSEAVVLAGERAFSVGVSLRSVAARLRAVARDANARRGMLAMPEHLLDDAGITDTHVRATVSRRGPVFKLLY